MRLPLGSRYFIDCSFSIEEIQRILMDETGCRQWEMDDTRGENIKRT